jgi:hypothetical protein
MATVKLASAQSPSAFDYLYRRYSGLNLNPNCSIVLVGVLITAQTFQVISSSIQSRVVQFYKINYILNFALIPNSFKLSRINICPDNPNLKLMR